MRPKKALLILVLGTATSAEGATLTGFLQGASPQARGGFGFAGAVGLFTEILSLEVEYSRSTEEETSPSLGLVTGSIVVGFPIWRLRPYAVTGFGFYRQSLADLDETSLAAAAGFGTFLHLAGPVEARFDYRRIGLRGDPLQEKQKRFYAGVTLRF